MRKDQAHKKTNNIHNRTSARIQTERPTGTQIVANCNIVKTIFNILTAHSLTS